MHNNTIKSAIVTPDNSTMLLPRCNTHFLTVDTVKPRRVKMKASNLQQSLSLNTGGHPTTKYSTLNTELSHMQEHQPAVIFARETPKPCKLARYGVTLDFLPTASGYRTQHNTSSTGTLHTCAFSHKETPVRHHR